MQPIVFKLLTACDTFSRVSRTYPKQCALQREGPAYAMALADQLGKRYTMEDVTERGQVVQTTMQIWPTAQHPTGMYVTWYRGRARCEQAQRTKQQSQEQRREKYR